MGQAPAQRSSSAPAKGPVVQVLPEKEARVIAAQVASGLAYLNENPRRIIHMDLVRCAVQTRILRLHTRQGTLADKQVFLQKPANCLFYSFGQVKLTVMT